ncbi:MAG: hypothetical protein ACREMS_07395 [Gemmatimonadaceae bacterium]
MASPSFDSPQAAALAGFPEGAARVLATRANGENAYVLLDTRPNGPRYVYGIECMRAGHGWVEGSSSNAASGWMITHRDSGLGMVVIWDDAPVAADLVRVALGSDIHEEPVENGVFLSAWWRIPCPENVRPGAIAFRVSGRWVEAR